MEEKKVKRIHNVKLENNKAISMTGVVNVPTFNEKSILVELDEQNLVIGGENLNVTSIDLESGIASATGKILSLKYTQKHSATTFLKKVFK